jgi:hypothetical protein
MLGFKMYQLQIFDDIIHKNIQYLKPSSDSKQFVC